MKASKIVLLLVCAAVVITQIGCGGGSGAAATAAATSSSARYNVTMGDAPSDSVVSFEITVTSIVLTGNGPAVTVLSKPTEIELTHLAGTVEPLAVMDVPAGTYTGATITISSAEATVINSSGTPVQATVSLPQTTISVPLSLTVTGTDSTLKFDLNLAQSLSVNLSSNPPTVTVTPVFAAAVSANAAAGEQEPEDGGMEDVTGSVSATTASGFSITMGQQTLTFNVDSNTKFEGVAGLAALSSGMLVQVNGVTQSDGSLLATKVEVEEQANGMEAEGVVTSVTGNPATSITLVAQDASAPSGNGPIVGSNITVNVTAAQYAVTSRADLSGLTFTFDATHIAAAQRVEVDAATPASNNLIANKVKLRNQGLRGTVSAIQPFGNGGSQFTLTVATDSAFAKLTGQTTVTVYRPASTRMMDNVNVTAGATVLVRGVLFFDGTAYDLVSVRMAPGQ